MARIGLIHWHEKEAAARAQRLRSLGHEVVPLPPDGRAAANAARADPPDLFVIDLARLPSRGRDMGAHLRRLQPTRRVPLVFVGGAPEKVAEIRDMLPDAVFTTWTRLGPALKRVVARPVADPIVPPPAMAGYSGTPLVKKLQIKPGQTLALSGAPGGILATLGDLPDGVTVRHRAQGTSDTLIWFVRQRRDLDTGLPAKIRALAERGGLWIAWPKQGSPLAGDLTQSDVRAAGLAAGLVDHKICAIDRDWSGLRFVRRRT